MLLPAVHYPHIRNEFFAWKLCISFLQLQSECDIIKLQNLIEKNPHTIENCRRKEKEKNARKWKKS